MKTVRINASAIKDWQTFHSVFAAAFGFPHFYGQNIDAWNDCMSSLDEEFNAFRVAPGESVCLVVDDAADLRVRCPAQYEAIVECSAFVNWRRIEQGGTPILVLAFHV